MDAYLFTNWLASHKRPEGDVSLESLLEEMPTWVLVETLYNAPAIIALDALLRLKQRFEWELNALEEMNRQQEEQEHANNWH